MLHGCRLFLRQDFSKDDERRCRDSWWWSPQLLCVALSSSESELFAAITSGTRSLGTDSQSVIDHSKRRGHSVASKHVGLRGLGLQVAPVDGKLELEKVETAMNLADVCANALPGNRIRELCRLARVYVCFSEGTMGDDPNESGI